MGASYWPARIDWPAARSTWPQVWPTSWASPGFPLRMPYASRPSTRQRRSASRTAGSGWRPVIVPTWSHSACARTANWTSCLRGFLVQLLLFELDFLALALDIQAETAKAAHVNVRDPNQRE